MSEQPKTRSYVAVAAFSRNSAGTMEKRGKGRVKKEGKSRSEIRKSLKERY